MELGTTIRQDSREMVGTHPSTCSKEKAKAINHEDLPEAMVRAKDTGRATGVVKDMAKATGVAKGTGKTIGAARAMARAMGKQTGVARALGKIQHSIGIAITATT